MTLSALLRHFKTPMLGAFFALCGYFSFGDPASFDKVCIGVLSVVFIYSIGRRDFNFTSLVFILLAWELVTEVVFLLDANKHVLIKFFFYTLLVLPSFVFKAHIPKAFRLGILGVIAWAIVNEIYWLTIGKQPALYWEVFIFSGYAYLSMLVFVRPFLLERFGKGLGKATNIDFYVHLLMLVSAFISALSIVEYTLRHSFGIPSMIIYEHYVFLMQLVALVALFVISRGYLRHVFDRLEA